MKKYVFYKSTYYTTGNLAVGFIGTYQRIKYEDIISVNLPDYTPKGYAYIDTNNYPFAPKLLEEQGIGRDTGIKGRSGFCQYPLFEIFEDKLIEIGDEE